MPSEKIILGIDPGTTLMGYGIIRSKGSQPELITLGVIDLRKFTNHYLKLQKIFERTLSLIDHHHPDEIAIEAPFYGKNVQSMLKLGRAQGVAMAAGLFRQVPIFEYAPLKIKMAITGQGKASKEQVAAILQKTMNIKELPQNLDATDGLAAAVCHFYQKPVPKTRDEATGQATGARPAHSHGAGWKDFIRKNPDRIKK